MVNSAGGGRPSNLRAVEDDILQELEANSVSSARHQVIRGSNTQSREFIPIRTLTSSRFAVYLSSDRLRNLVSERTFYRFCAARAQHIKSGQKWCDLCDICESFRNKVAPRIAKAIREVVAAITSLQGCSHYFKDLDVLGPSAEATAKLIRTYTARLDDDKRSFRTKLSQAVRFDLHSMEAEHAHKLRKWLRLRELYEHHREGASRQHEQYRSVIEALPPGVITIRCDYKQNITVPLCPRETGSMWYARARRQLTVFGAEVTQRTSPEQAPCVTYVLFLSTIIEHSARFTIELLKALEPHLQSTATQRPLR